LKGHLYAEERWREVDESKEGRRRRGQAQAMRWKGKKLTGRANMSTGGEREHNLAKGATQRTKCIPKNAPKALRPVGPGERWRPMGRGRQARAELGRPGRIPREDSNGKNDFRISMEFEIWQDFGKFYKEIYEEFGHEDFS
jgi:hypothetical protein